MQFNNNILCLQFVNNVCLTNGIIKYLCNMNELEAVRVKERIESCSKGKDV